jgi:hypothetical protein
MKEDSNKITATDNRFLRFEASQEYASFIASEIRKNPEHYKQHGVFIKGKDSPVYTCRSYLISHLEAGILKEIRINTLEESSLDSEVCFDLDNFTQDYIDKEKSRQVKKEI